MVVVAESPRKKVYVEGHGCSASLADTEILQGLIEGGGYELVEDQLSADVSVLVTCSVKSVTEQRMISRIRDISQNGTRRLIVAGCLPKADPAKIKLINPALSMIGPGNLDQIVPTINDALSGKQTIKLDSSKLVKLGMPRSRLNKVVGIVEISSGCLSGCTFCQVKLIKGNVFSYPEDQIVDEVRSMIDQGAREIWLTSTDNAAYGRDSKSSLPSLIRRVASLQGNFKIRVGMMNPLLTRNLADELVDCFKDEKVFKFIHLPVQSGSERILKLMRRGYRLDDFLKMVKVFRNAIPGITLSTDMIVGFPTETESEFEQSQELLKQVRPDIVNISRFGPRQGTIASTLEGQIDSNTSKSRSSRMTSLVKHIQRETNSKWIGWKGRVLIDEIVKDALVGRNFAYKPCLFTKDQLRQTDEILGEEVVGCVKNCTSSTLRMDICDW
ncbi:MAG: tRNA (N(6)-L-threonylcarbamoyladenosine(37)-C(2))-methylthiotransferase [Nitrososphaerota archaeon]|nr:tRNA (N(6)-L-threonylcarbamoyladenosine(37)-C(2))-methylthiotransferase [Nitrososphaerota archaeon]